MVTAAFCDLIYVKASLVALEEQVAIAHANLHFNPDPAQLEAWTVTLIQAKEQADSAWKIATKVAVAIKDLRCYFYDFLHYEILYHKLVKEACIIGDALSNHRNIIHLKDVCAQCDALTSDRTSAIGAKTDAAREYIALTSHSFTQHEELKDPDPLPLLDKVVLPTPYYFAKGSWFRGVPYLGYRKLTGTIQYLESIAHRLYYLERKLKEQMRPPFQLDETLILQVDDLDKRLAEYLDVLKSKQRSNEIQAGWFYLKTLKAYASTVRVAIEQFQQDCQSAFALHVSLSNRLVSYIESQDTSLYPLYEMWVALSAIVDKERLPHSYPQLKQLLHVTARTCLNYTTEELAVPKCLFGGSWTSKELLSGYVMKGIILSLTFCPNVDSEFELVLAKCESSATFRECLERSIELVSLYQDYRKQHEIKHYKTLLQILEWLEAPVPIATCQEALAYYQFMRYYQALYALTEITTKGIQTPRVAYVAEVLRQKDEEWQAALKLPYEPKTLFDCLCRRLFGHNPDANDAIYNNVKIEERSPLVTILLYRWALEELVVTSTVEGITKQVSKLTLEKDARKVAIQRRLLQLFFAAYEKDPVIKSFFTLFYGDEYLKKALLLSQLH